MTSLGFENYSEALRIYLVRYREVCCLLLFPAARSLGNTVLAPPWRANQTDAIRHRQTCPRTRANQARAAGRRQATAGQAKATRAWREASTGQTRMHNVRRRGHPCCHACIHWRSSADLVRIQARRATTVTAPASRILSRTVAPRNTNALPPLVTVTAAVLARGLLWASLLGLPSFPVSVWLSEGLMACDGFYCRRSIPTHTKKVSLSATRRLCDSLSSAVPQSHHTCRLCMGGFWSRMAHQRRARREKDHQCTIYGSSFGSHAQ